jgi:hypothetical protein
MLGILIVFWFVFAVPFYSIPILLSVIFLLDLFRFSNLVFEQDYMTFETMANACDVRLDESEFISTTSLWPDSSRLNSFVHAL